MRKLKSPRFYEVYINKSLEYDPDNLFSAYVKAYILYAKNRDLSQLKELLLSVLDRDSTRLDIMQEVGKICYFMRDYESAYFYYQKFIAIKKAQNLNIYSGEDIKIGVVFSKMGQKEEAEKLFDDYFQYATNDESIYKHLSLAMYYSNLGNTKKAIEELELFAHQDNYHFWTIIFLEIDPLTDNIRDLPEFKKIFNVIETKFWDSHKRIRVSLAEKGLL